MPLRRISLALGFALLAGVLLWLAGRVAIETSGSVGPGVTGVPETRASLFGLEIPVIVGTALLPIASLAAWLGSGFVFALGSGRHVGHAFAALAAVALGFGVYVTTYHLHLGGMGLFLLVGVVLLPIVFAFGTTWANRRSRGFAKLGRFVQVLLLCGAYASLPFYPWGMRIAALLSRPALNDLADRVLAGEALELPTRAGFFVVREVKTKRGAVALVIRDNWAGDSALTRFPPGSRGDADTNGIDQLAYYGPMYNLNWNVPLGGGWRYQDED